MAQGREYLQQPLSKLQLMVVMRHGNCLYHPLQPQMRHPMSCNAMVGSRMRAALRTKLHTALLATTRLFQVLWHVARDSQVVGQMAVQTGLNWQIRMRRQPVGKLQLTLTWRCVRL